MQSKPTDVRPFVHTGDSANIAFYRERGANLRGAPKRKSLTVEVLHSFPLSARETGPKTHRYHFTVTAPGEGEIGAFTYEPKTQQRRGRLPDRTVTRLVREALGP